MEYKKSYKLLWLWLVLFMLLMAAAALLPIEDTSKAILVTLNACNGGVALLSFIIYKTRFIYWYNGIEFEEAKAAGEERRIAYGYAHWRLFGGFAALYFVYSLCALIIPFGIALHIILDVVGLIATAFATMKIKL